VCGERNFPDAHKIRFALILSEKTCLTGGGTRMSFFSPAELHHNFASQLSVILRRRAAELLPGIEGLCRIHQRRPPTHIDCYSKHLLEFPT
jgi:hypothetical protein